MLPRRPSIPPPCSGTVILCASGARYTLLEVVGATSHATLFKATMDGAPFPGVCAVKVINKHGIQPERLQEVQRDLFVMQQVNHPNVMRLRDYLETPDFLFLVTDFMEGGELFPKIVATGRYNECDAANIVRQIVSGVAHLHSLGIAHRNLKPENLLCSKDENMHVVVSDFALAKSFGRGELLVSSVGTFHYAAPEVVRNSGQAYTHACDMWSVGCITFILLTGCYPWPTENTQQMRDAILNGEYQAARLTQAGVSSMARKFIQDLLVVEPSHRLTADQALAHEWLQADLTTTRKRRSSLTGCLDNLNNFNKRARIGGT